MSEQKPTLSGALRKIGKYLSSATLALLGFPLPPKPVPADAVQE